MAYLWLAWRLHYFWRENDRRKMSDTHGDDGKHKLLGTRRGHCEQFFFRLRMRWKQWLHENVSMEKRTQTTCCWLSNRAPLIKWWMVLYFSELCVPHWPTSQNCRFIHFFVKATNKLLDTTEFIHQVVTITEVETKAEFELKDKKENRCRKWVEVR